MNETQVLLVMFVITICPLKAYEEASRQTTKPAVLGVMFVVVDVKEDAEIYPVDVTEPAPI